MPRRGWLLLVLAACGRKDAPASQAPARYPEVNLPVVRHGFETLPENAFVVTLADEGVVFAEDRPVTLEGLGTALAERASRHPWKDLPGGVRVSEMPVLVRADDAAPWMHAQWVLCVCLEQRIHRAYLAARAPGDPSGPTSGAGRALDARLPTDKGIASGKPSAETFVVETWIQPAASGERVWAGARVKVPVAFRYEFGEDRTEALEELSGWIREELAAARAEGISGRVRGLIKAGQHTPTGRIAELLSLYVTSGYQRTEFFGTAIPPATLRKVEVLPYPHGEPR